MPYVNCHTCQNGQCPRSNGSIGYSFCDHHISSKPTNADRLRELAEADRDGRIVVLPCKVGDVINAFRFNEGKGLHVISDKVTAVTYNRNGYTVRTKCKFYPIKQADGDVFAPISDYPNALADYYIGSAEAAEKALEGTL